jgi:LysR family hydrogen peroxide-inducible transcriptional activator
MTLTELRYIVAVARERHFGRAAEACFVSQPTLSVAIKKLEEELDVKLFERGGSEVSITPIGGEIIEQAQRVLEQSSAIREIAKRGKDPLAGPLRVGVIYTVAPYLLPPLVRRVIELTPQMPLLLQEQLTVRLLEMLRNGELDVAVLAEPFPDHGLATAPLYDEPFLVAVPRGHRLAHAKPVRSEEIRDETMLLLGTGHCFRDHVLEVCPEFARFSPGSEGIRKSFEGSSLETIKHMVASGMGITILPRMSAQVEADAQGGGTICYVPFLDPVPTRRVVLAWRKTFTRTQAIEALRRAVLECELPGVHKLDAPMPDAAAPAQPGPQAESAGKGESGRRTEDDVQGSAQRGPRGRTAPARGGRRERAAAEPQA